MTGVQTCALPILVVHFVVTAGRIDRPLSASDARNLRLNLADVAETGRRRRSVGRHVVVAFQLIVGVGRRSERLGLPILLPAFCKAGAVISAALSPFRSEIGLCLHPA